MNNPTFLISRTDSIGDVILSLPVAGVLKEKYPQCSIIFLGREYTKAILEACKHIDTFWDWNKIKNLPKSDRINYLKNRKIYSIIHVFPNRAIAQLAKDSKIPIRVGTIKRLYHWGTCNRLVFLSRKKSKLHEAQLNLKLLRTFDADKNYQIKNIPQYYGLEKIKTLDSQKSTLFRSDKYNLILHPKSRGSGKEWGLKNFSHLIDLLDEDKFQIFITGSEQEGNEIHTLLVKKNIIDMTGQLTLEELISFISLADGLLAASTGPLHIAAALGIQAIGLYSPNKPIHPGRWCPLGLATHVFVEEKLNEKYLTINPLHVHHYLSQLYSQKFFQ